MSITADQIITSGMAMYRGSTAVDDDGCERVLRFMVAPDVAQAIEKHVRARRGNALMSLIALSGDDEPADAAPSASTGRYAAQAQALRESGWLSRVDVAQALGSDDDYHAWVSYQPSVVSGGYSETDDAGERRNVPCHVRRAAAAGTSYKPPFSQVPMTHDEHHRQHQYGELAVYVRWQRLQGVAPLSLERADAQRWFDQQADRARMQWVEAQLCARLGADDLASVAPIDVVGWAQSAGLDVPDMEEVTA